MAESSRQVVSHGGVHTLARYDRHRHARSVVAQPERGTMSALSSCQCVWTQMRCPIQLLPAAYCSSLAQNCTQHECPLPPLLFPELLAALPPFCGVATRVSVPFGPCNLIGPGHCLYVCLLCLIEPNNRLICVPPPLASLSVSHHLQSCLGPCLFLFR